MREGDGPKIVHEMIAANRDIARAGARRGGQRSAGPAGDAFLRRSDAGKLPVPLMIIPGALDMDAIDRLS